MELDKDKFLVEVEINNSPAQFEIDSDNILELIKEISEGENLTYFSKITRRSDGFSIEPHELCNAIQNFQFYLGSESIKIFIDKFAKNLGINETLLSDLDTFQGYIELIVREHRGLKSS